MMTRIWMVFSAANDNVLWRTSVLSVGLALCWTGTAANADTTLPPDGVYVVGSVGSILGSTDYGRIATDLQSSGFMTRSVSEDISSTGYKLDAGYQFTPHWAVEGGYVDLGQHRFTAITTPAGTLSGDRTISAVNLDIVGSMPVSDAISVFARAGLISSRVHDSYTSSGAVKWLLGDETNNSLNVKVGAGAQYAVTPKLMLRLEDESYRTTDGQSRQQNINLLSLSLVYRFGAQ